jgi:hypothetical protein
MRANGDKFSCIFGLTEKEVYIIMYLTNERLLVDRRQYFENWPIIALNQLKRHCTYSVNHRKKTLKGGLIAL